MNTFYTNVQASGDNILYRGYENGERVEQKIQFQPTLYVPSKNSATKFRTIRGEPVEPIMPGSIRECEEFVKTYEDVQNFKIHGHTDWIYQYISSLYPDHCDAQYDMSIVRVLYLDIETECENGFSSPKDAAERINVITLRHGDRKFVLAINDFKLPDDPNVSQEIFSDDRDLLDRFIDIWNDIDPDIVTGWNVRFFDIPYIINRIKIVFGEQGKTRARDLSPWRNVRDDEIEYKGKTQQVYKISGIDILDYYELYRKYVLSPRESYKLDYIASVELGKKKMDYSEYGHIRNFYTNNFQKFVEYNVKDVDLVHELDEKLNLLELHVSMAYLAKTNYNDVFGQVRMWDTIIYNHLLRTNTVISQKRVQEKDSQYAGAFVKDPIVGFHDWVVSFDVASLYPHLVIQYNIGPDTIVEDAQLPRKYTIDQLLKEDIDNSYIKKNNYAMAANGQLFRRNRMGFLPELMDKFYNERKKSKKLAMDGKKQLQSCNDAFERRRIERSVAKYDTMQMAYKIALNSAYGAIGNQYFRHYDVRQAEAITLSGQLSIRWIQNKINEHLNKLFSTNNRDYVIASDTDSVYLNLSQAVKISCAKETDKNKIVDFLDKFCRKIVDPFIEKCYQQLADRMNAYAQKMEMKREVIADRGLWKAKKMYCLNVYDSEGIRYSEPQLKIMGIEVQRSSTPSICRQHLKQCVKIILTQDEQHLIDYIDKFKSIFFASAPEDISFPRGVNGMDKYSSDTTIFRKGTPIHVKGALIYNQLLDKLKINKLYTKIGDGDKIKFLYLREPNPTTDRVISYIGKIPPEMKLDKFVDYNAQFEKAFLDPLIGLLEVIGWHHEHKNSLEGFFA